MDYITMLERIAALRSRGYRTEIAGVSVLGRNIPAVITGNDGLPAVLIHGSIHAREHITTRLVLDLIESHDPVKSQIWYVPMVNPDGVEICYKGLASVTDDYKKRFLSGITRDIPTAFGNFKANANAVDLNVNFNADWGEGVSNVTYPAIENYIGPYPFSEPETKMLKALSERIIPVLTISYHISGEEIYWRFNGFARYRHLAKRFSELTSYPLRDAIGSAGGYKDWYLTRFKGMGLTIEAGRELGYPYPESEYHDIWSKNKGVARLSDEVADIISRQCEV